MPSYRPPKMMCPCCASERFTTQFPSGSGICQACLDGYTPSQLFARGREAAESEHRYRTQTRAGRKAARVDQRRAAQNQAGGKRCSSCHARKPTTSEHFGACASRGDGLQVECIECARARASLMRRPGGLELWRTLRAALRQRNEPAAPAAQQPLPAPGRISG